MKKELNRNLSSINSIFANDIKEFELAENIEYTIDFGFQKSTFERIKIYSIYNGIKVELNSYNIIQNGGLNSILASFYSTANLNYNLNPVKSITTIDLDKIDQNNSIITQNDIGTIIKQTFVDIYNLDAQDFQKWAKENVGKTIDDTKIEVRIKRFENAFKFMIEGLSFYEINNNNSNFYCYAFSIYNT